MITTKGHRLSLSAMAKASSKKKSVKSGNKKVSFSQLGFAPGFWKKHWKEALIIPVLSFALYWMSLQFGYVLDDQIVITENQYTQKGVGGIWDILSKESFSGYFGEQRNLVAGARYRPLSIVTFAMEQSVFGDNPFIRHFINILLYGLAGLMIFRLFSILMPVQNDKKWYVAIPFLAAVLYILHPVHSEVVANIKGRDEIMTAMGGLGALYFALLYLFTRKQIWLIASGIAMFLGLLSKENAITFLAVIPLTIYFFTAAKTRDYLVTLLPSFIAVVIYLIIRTNVIGYLLNSGIKIDDLMNDPFIGMTGGERFATIMYTLGQYIRLLVFPHPLTHDYYPYHIPIMDFTDPGTLISLALYGGLAYLFYRGWKKKIIYAWSIGFFLATISIVSNFLFPVGTFMNERFIFIPSIAFSLVTAWALARHGFTSDKAGIRIASYGLLLLLVVGYAIKTYDRVPAWKDSLSLNGQAVLVSKNSARANCFMATALYEVGRDTADQGVKTQMFMEAEYYAKRALDIHPSYPAANQIYSGLVAERYRRDGDLQKLLDEFAKILEAYPETEYVYLYCEYLNKSINPQTMVDFYYKVAYEMMANKLMEYPMAVKYLKLAETIAPQNALILYALGQSLYKGGDQVQGTEYLQRAYQLNPSLRDVN